MTPEEIAPTRDEIRKEMSNWLFWDRVKFWVSVAAGALIAAIIVTIAIAITTPP